ncbi:MAG: type II secretion system F family protein [Nanoarchaeota archaeon]|nr:type II secretion system F family protein [Nanoarchaeota archaeon]MBU1501854.1 type II secretion system F family protein [Nanoarchaeota archaeon]MBU2458739.1 type II secretion system F family protein [Nanoarchaeota archaeon]
MEIKKVHLVGLVVAFVLMGTSFFVGSRFSFFVMGLGVLIGAFPFIFSLINETRISVEKEEMFLEFARNLVESVKTGTPINKSILNVKDKAYGVLSENIRKLANQISMGITLNKALQTFSHDVNNKTISRSLTLISQAEKSGGEIGGILEAVTEAVSMSDKLKKEREASISTLVVQGYIIFFVFIVIILVLQYQILPLLTGIAPVTGSGLSSLGSGLGGGGNSISNQEVSSSFLYLLLVQGLFTGFVVGKLASDNIKAGIKHSFILMILAFTISTGAGVIFGG